jgi:hypothetical protein
VPLLLLVVRVVALLQLRLHVVQGLCHHAPAAAAPAASHSLGARCLALKGKVGWQLAGHSGVMEELILQK